MKALSRLEAALLRGCGSLLAPGGGRGSLLVLIYHRVLETADPLLSGEPTAQAFTEQMDVIRNTCHVLPLSEAVERLGSGSLPPRAACITFDDGYANNRTVAAPLLAARKIPATVFVATGFIGTGRMWNDTVIECVRRAPGQQLDLSALGLDRYSLADWPARRRAFAAIVGALKYLPLDERLTRVAAIAERVGVALPDDLMMSESQIRELGGFGIEIGAHTVTHPILKRLDAPAAQREIEASKSMLEAITGRAVTTFAYPNGRPNQDYDASHVEMVRRAGFRTAVSTAWGAAGRHSDPYQIPRMLPWDRSSLKFGARLMTTYRAQRAAVA
jgi:peptidoglycan/xylan/chitin deacetylase (PgdA/CDA1 family)